MRKSAVVIPVLALLAGVFGFLIRRVELDTAFEAATGFAKRGEPISLVLIAISAAAAVLAVVAGIVVSRRMLAEKSYSRAFAPGGFLYLIVSFILGIAWLGAVALHFFDIYGEGPLNILNLIFVFLAAVSAFSLMILSRGAYKGRSSAEMLVFSVIPSVFFCFWLILLYKDNAANPVLLSFAYQCLAIVAAALSFYFSAGFVYRKAAAGKTVFSYLTAVYFCAVAMADPIDLPLKIIFGVVVVNSLMNSIVFLRNLKAKDEN